LSHQQVKTKLSPMMHMTHTSPTRDGKWGAYQSTPTWNVYCRCGWFALDYSTQNRAREAGDYHLREVDRAARALTYVDDHPCNWGADEGLRKLRLILNDEN
jgi:hypothetical protein